MRVKPSGRELLLLVAALVILPILIRLSSGTATSNTGITGAAILPAGSAPPAGSPEEATPLLPAAAIPVVRSPDATLPSRTWQATQNLQTAQAAAQMNPSGYTSARVCGTCHVDIYNSWKNSLHAFSLTDPIFDSSFMQALKMGGDAARERCLHCHAPMTMVNGDYQLREGVTHEGVSCDFCHTVTNVYVDGRAKPFDIDLGMTKRSVLRQAESPAHEVAYSELHASSKFCGGCHVYKNPSGLTIMGTYEEWLEGPYAQEGVQCQDCHMLRSIGDVVSTDVQPGPDTIHLHSLIHDNDQLRSALTVQITSADRRDGTLYVGVEVENVGSGHMVPTGIPTREVVLTVQAEEGGRVWSKERIYRKVVTDADGKLLFTDHEILLNGSSILTDNRIRPREKRTENFVLQVQASGLVKLSAIITYRYAPSILRVQPMNFELGRSERYIQFPFPDHRDRRR